MPIYEYRCEACGNDFEKRVARSVDSESVNCPSCGNPRPTKRFSTFATVTSNVKTDTTLPACPSGACCPNRGMCGLE